MADNDMLDTASSNTPELTESELTNFARGHAEEVARQYMKEAARLWRRVDGFSTWATAAGGASIAVAITQLSLIRTALGVGGSRALFWTLASSVLAGLIAKYLGFSVGIVSAFSDVNEKILNDFFAEKEEVFARIRSSPKAIEKYLAPLFVLYRREMRPAIPFVLRPLLDTTLRTSMTSSRRPEYGQLRWLLWQLLAVHLQLLCLVVAVVISAFAA